MKPSDLLLIERFPPTKTFPQSEFSEEFSQKLKRCLMTCDACPASEREPGGGPLRADLPGPGRVLGHGEHPGGPDTRQVQQARGPQEGGLGRQGESHQDILVQSKLVSPYFIEFCRPKFI